MKPTFPKIEGLVAAPFTPMRKDGRLWLDQVAPYAALLARNGVVGAFVAGSTGEGLSLTLAERLALAERWVKDAPAALRVIVHVGENSVETCRQLAAHAQGIGAAAVAVIPPSYFKPATVGQLVAYCRSVAAAAPELPFYFYHIPALTGVDFPMRTFLREAAGCIPNLAGVKFTYENLMDYAQCVALDGGRFDMLFGRDEILLCGLTLGARGAVGSSYNYAAPLYTRLMAAYAAGDLEAARGLQLRAQEMFLAMWGTGLPGMTSGKALMKLVGVDCGAPRLPFVGITPAGRRRLAAALERVGFSEYACR